MRNSDIVAVLIAAVCVIGLAGCGSKSAAVGAGSAPAPLPPEIEIKERLLRGSPVGVDNRLSVGRHLRRGEGGAFIHPASLFSTEDGGIYVSDNNGHSIFYSPPDGSTAVPLRQQEGVGRLSFPNTIYLRKGQIFVTDNDGLKIYGQDGSFRQLIRTYYGVFSFVVSDDDRIYANAYLNAPKDSDPLIVEMDGKGRKLRGLGRRLNLPGYNGAADHAYLATTGNLLFAALKHRPALQMFDRRGGTLINEVKIDHAIFERLPGELSGTDAGKTALPRYIAGVSLADDSVFVLLHLPRLEIVEFNLQGGERARYYCDDLPTIANYFGFAARSGADGYVFTVGVQDPRWLPSIVEVRSTKPTNLIPKEEKL